MPCVAVIALTGKRAGMKSGEANVATFGSARVAVRDL